MGTHAEQHEHKGDCCTPSRGHSGAPKQTAVGTEAAEAPDHTAASESRSSREAPRSEQAEGAYGHRPVAMTELPGGWFLMGTEDEVGFPDDGEGPVREVYVSPFAMDRYAVTNREFSRFVEATGYVTDAERFGWSFVFRNFIPKVLFKKQQVRTVPGLEWWYAVTDANWYRPEGRGSNIRKRMDHPVVHVSWNDARAYCRWAGARLPTEAEWEYAARGGLSQKRYVWGDELHPRGKHMCNIWQGDFPERNTADDGYRGTAPVDAFKPNGYGLYNMAGNVWEWCADFWSATYHADGPREDPAGPPRGTSRVMRGGSYLCHHSYCNRYRVAARTSNTPDSSTGNMGFRCVRSPGTTQ